MDSSQTLSDYLNLSAKTSTFVSIDVAGSTQLKVDENEQDIIYTFLSYHKLVSQVAYAHHGEVIHITGDGMMCRFERPEDAARMGCALLDQLPAFNKKQNHLSRPLHIRIGAHTGEVLQSEQQSSGQIISQTIDLAAKLQQGAPTDGICFSEATVSAVQALRLPLAKKGWDAKLQINVYEWAGKQTSETTSRKLPSPVRVLVAEQELDEVMRLKKALWARQHETFAVFTLAQAEIVISAWKPHMVILSLDLPWEGGWELLQKLRSDSQFSPVPILATSAQSTGQTIERVLNKGGNGFLRKPLEEQQILKRAEMALREFYL